LFWVSVAFTSREFSVSRGYRFQNRTQVPNLWIFFFFFFFWAKGVGNAGKIGEIVVAAPRQNICRQRLNCYDLWCG